MHPQEQTVTESSQRTSPSSMTNNSYLSSGQSKLKETYHMPYERLRFVQRLLRYPYSFTPNWCSCGKNNPSHSGRWAEQGVNDQCVLLKEESTEIAASPTSTYSWLTCFNKMNAHLSAYRLELEMWRQDKSYSLQKGVCADHNECGVQVSSTHNDTLRDNKSCYRESEQQSELEYSTYKNSTMINLISPLSESTLRKSKWESFKEGEDGRPMTAIGHMARKIHSIPPPLTHHEENTIHEKKSSNVSIINNNNHHHTNSTKEVIDETHYNINKDEANDSNADKTNILHKSRVAGTNLADYMWCHVEEKNIAHCKNNINNASINNRNSNRKSQTEDKLNARKSTSSYYTEIDLTSAEEILKSENEHDDIYLFVNTSNSSVKAPEGHSQSSENEPFISLNLPELKHCIAAITPSITALTNNTDDDTETDTTPTGRQLFRNSSDKGYSHSHQLVYSVRDRQLGDNAISTFSLTSRPQTPSTQQVEDGREIHSDKTELFCVELVSEEEHLHWQSEYLHEQSLEKKKEEEEEQEQLRMEKHELNEDWVTPQLTASPKEHAICLDMAKENNGTNAMNVIDLTNTFDQVNGVAPAERKENVLTTPNIQTPSNSMVPLCSPPACDSTGVRETSPEQDTVVSDNDVRINISDKTNSHDALHNRLEFLWNDKNIKDNKTITINEYDKIKNAEVHDSVHENDINDNIDKNKLECEERQYANVDVANAALNGKKGMAEKQHNEYNKKTKHNNICKNDIVGPQVHNSTLNAASYTDTRCFVQPKETNSVWTSDTDSGTNRPEHSTGMPPSPPLTPNTNTFTEPELPHEPLQEILKQEPRWVSGELYRTGTAIRRVNSLEELQTNHHTGSRSMVAKLHNWVKTLDSENDNQKREHSESLQLPSASLTAVNDKCEVGKRPASCSNSNCNHRHYSNHNGVLFSRLPSKFHTIELKSERMRLNAFKYNYVK